MYVLSNYFLKLIKKISIICEKPFNHVIFVDNDPDSAIIQQGIFYMQEEKILMGVTVHQ